VNSAALSGVLGAPVEGLTRLSGGANRETWALTAGGRDLVLRGGAGTGSVGLHVEAEAMTAAARAGVPVPEVVHAGELDGSPYLLMARVDGETIPRRILRDAALAAPGRARELGALLARLHTVPLAEVPAVKPAGDPLAALHGGYLTDGRVPPPGLALGLRELAGTRPEPAGETLVHGDFRLGNLMLGPDGVRAVLDWELVHTGDPVEDLGWLCAKVWRFGSPHPAGGLGSREELLDGYGAVAGWRPSAAQLRWWELYATVRWGLMTGLMAERHLSGAEPSVELAAIGRRACEQEFDVLLALGLAAPDPAVPPEPADDDAALYGRPTATDLLEAVTAFLAGDVQPGGDRVGFHARVAGNVLATVRRELALGPAARERHRARLARLGCPDDAALSRAILDGGLDDRWDDVLDAVRSDVRDRVLVANPRHLTAPA
jgi:aminoglycoside phosphotransferase (APT) family kinase protein